MTMGQVIAFPLERCPDAKNIRLCKAIIAHIRESRRIVDEYVNFPGDPDLYPEFVERNKEQWFAVYDKVVPLISELRERMGRRDIDAMLVDLGVCPGTSFMISSSLEVTTSLWHHAGLKIVYEELPEEHSLTPEEAELLAIYNSLPEKQKKAMLKKMRARK